MRRMIRLLGLGSRFQGVTLKDTSTGAWMGSVQRGLGITASELQKDENLGVQYEV